MERRLLTSRLDGDVRTMSDEERMALKEACNYALEHWRDEVDELIATAKKTLDAAHVAHAKAARARVEHLIAAMRALDLEIEIPDDKGNG